ncbi:hypothetical protein CBX98_18965 [Vibrio sp. T9]|nr:hypothetical protein CBX98_18965 [Vibrio sp. T9]
MIMRLIIKCVFAMACKVFYPFLETTMSIVSLQKTKSPASWTLSSLAFKQEDALTITPVELMKCTLGRYY